MNPVIALWKKDFRLNAPWVFGGLLSIVAVHLLILLTVKTKEAQFALSMAPFALHAIYFPVYLFLSLQGESKQLHQWLHTPHAASALILSKVINGVAALLVSATIAAIYPLILLLGPMDISQKIELATFFSFGFQIVVIVFSTSIQFGLFILVIWAVYRWLKTYTRGWTWIWITALTFTWWWGLAQFLNTDLYDWLTQWGPVLALGKLELDNPLYLGVILFEALQAVAYFALAAWLLERKVEG